MSEKIKISKEAFWELLNGLVDDIEESEIEKLERQLKKQYEVIDDEMENKK